MPLVASRAKRRAGRSAAALIRSRNCTSAADLDKRQWESSEAAAPTRPARKLKPQATRRGNATGLTAARPRKGQRSLGHPWQTENRVFLATMHPAVRAMRACGQLSAHDPRHARGGCRGAHACRREACTTVESQRAARRRPSSALGKGYIDGGSYASREEAGLDLPNLDWGVFHAVMLLGNLTRRFPRHRREQVSHWVLLLPRWKDVRTGRSMDEREDDGCVELWQMLTAGHQTRPCAGVSKLRSAEAIVLHRGGYDLSYIGFPYGGTTSANTEDQFGIADLSPQERERQGGILPRSNLRGVTVEVYT